MAHFIQRSVVLAFLLQTSLAVTQEQPEVIHIHQVVRAINNEAGCNPLEWDKKFDDACSCCLLYNQSKSNGKKTADEIVAHCTKGTKQCTESSIIALKKQRGMSNASSQELLNSLSSDGIVIKKMNVDASFFNESGILTETSLPKFLAQAFSEKKLTNMDFSKEACLKAKNLGTQGGYNTLQLFLVTSTCQPTAASMYIVKEARHGLDEAIKLATVAEFPKMKDIVAPKIVPGLPTISLPVGYFSYPKNNAIHYIAAMPAAKGKDLATLINKFREDQSEKNKELLNRAFLILGKETANFHKRFMQAEKGKKLGKTTVHGDFHVFNLFFDEIGGHFTFIDNETIANSLKDRVSPSVDLVKLFFMPFSTNQDYQQFRDLIQGVDLQTWYSIALKNFVTGYKDAYPANEQKQVLQELQKIFNDPFQIAWVDFYDEQLKEMRAKYINPIFTELLKK
ncbi:MAG TPA: hypothetical protein VJJ26_05410 [Candidatus Babeliales bacterium]|nr:hypothetical protein [Candidatus Babeliales bacterium]